MRQERELTMDGLVRVSVYTRDVHSEDYPFGLASSVQQLV